MHQFRQWKVGPWLALVGWNMSYPGDQDLATYIYLSIHPSIHPSIHLTIYPSIHPSIYLSIYLCVCRAITGLRWSWWHSIVSLANCFTQVLLLSLYMSISISFIYTLYIYIQYMIIYIYAVYDYIYMYSTPSMLVTEIHGIIGRTFRSIRGSWSSRWLRIVQETKEQMDK